MATTVTFSKDELGWLLKAINEVKKEEVRDYLAEAGRCLGADASRAAVVLGWSAIVHYLRQTILQTGFDHFRQTTLQLVRERRLTLKLEDAKSLRPDNWDDSRLRDEDLLQVCAAIGILGASERDHLKKYQQLRNDCAHPSRTLLMPGEALGLLQYILDRILTASSGWWPLPASFFEQFLTDPGRELSRVRARTLIEFLRKSEYLALVGKLLGWYHDSYQSVDPNGPRQEDIAATARSRVPVLWEALAGKLTTVERVQANRKMAELFREARALGQVWWREFVFWDQWKESDAETQLLITSHLLPEFAELVDPGPVDPTDLQRLEIMTQSAVDANRQECEDLLERARRVVRMAG